MHVRRLILALLFITLTSSALLAQSPSPLAADRQRDSVAILKAIEMETRNFYKKDFAAWSRSYLHSADLFWLCVEPGVSLRAKGWAELSAFVADWMKANPQPMDYEGSDFQHSRITLALQPAMAFVTLEGSNLQEDGKTRRYSRGSRTLVKEGGEWKLLAMVSYPADQPAGSSANIYKHRSE